MERIHRHPWLAGIAKLFYHPPPTAGVDDLVAEQFRMTRDWLSAFLARGQDIGMIRTDLPGGLLLSMVISAAEAADHWMAEHWNEVPPADLDHMATEVFSTLRRLVEPGA
jgi:hypothetical protein